MMKASLVLFGIGLLSALAGAGCATNADGQDDDESESESTEDELRSFRAGELLGKIAYGETKTVDHSATPTYRAYAFDAAKNDEIEITVSAAGHDAVVWLLGAANQSLAKVNAFRDTRAESVVYKATKTGRLHIAFREADYERATFTVSLAKKNGGTPPATSAVATCSGAPRLPATGTFALTSATRHEYVRSCDASGTCSAWTLATERLVGAGLGRVIEVHPGGFTSAGSFALGSSISPWGSDMYTCRREDAARGVTFDASGRGSTQLQTSERCSVSGSSGQTSVGSDRPADVILGQTCIAFAEQDPPPSNGPQKKVVYIAPLQ